MIRHDVTVAWRRMLRDRLHAVVSVVALALGLACFMAAYLFVSHLRSYDRQFAHGDRAYVLYSKVFRPGGFDAFWSTGTGLRIADQLRVEVPQLEAVARLRYNYNGSVTIDGTRVDVRIAYVEPSFLDIFDFDTVEGDLGAALRQPRSAVLTKEGALKLFGRRDVVGKGITVSGNGTADVTVSAVIENLPVASHLGDGLFASGFDLLVSWDVEEAIAETPADNVWLNGFATTYVLLPMDGSLDARELDARLAALVKDHMPYYGGTTMTLAARPVGSIVPDRLQRTFEGYYGAWGVDIADVLLLFGGGILILACINFVNLATARSLGRARAIGARKAVGATAALLVRQELTHTALLVAVALGLALLAVAPAGGLLQGPWQATISVPWGEPRLWLSLLALLSAVTLAAGAYPALLLARVRPVVALRGLAGAGPVWLRTWLVGMQFAAAAFFTIAVVVSLTQNAHSRAAVLDRFKDPYLTVGRLTAAGPMPIDPAVLDAELRGRGIKAVTGASVPLFSITLAQLVARSPETAGPKLDATIVGFDYFDVMQTRLIAGRTFSRDRSDDIFPISDEQSKAKRGPSHVVIDRAAARSLGFAEPQDAVGQPLYLFGNPKLAYEVIGVVETVAGSIRATDAGGNYYTFNPLYAPYAIVRVDKNDVAAALAQIDRVLDTVLPNHLPIQKTFMDEAFANAFWTFTVINRVFAGIALFAIAISAIGLFGMASYMTQRRKHEIGIRKSQGASRNQILRLLLWDFSKPVLVANVLVWPAAFYGVERYLALFAQRIALTPIPFLLALGATLLLALATVVTRAWGAARVPPVDSLRFE